MIPSNQARKTIADIRWLAGDIRARLGALSSADIRNADGSSALDLDALDTMDADFTHSLSQVRRLRNMQAPVNTLPPEILVMVFEILAGSRELSPTSPWSPPPTIVKSMDWVPATHVCQYWRETALGNPFIWSPVVFNAANADDTASLPYEWLQRSADAPIDVHIESTGSNDPHLWRELSAHCHKLRRLHVRKLVDVQDLLRMNHPAPLLQSLCVQVSGEVINLWALRRRLSFNKELPLLFAGQTPALRYLTLTYFTKFAANQFTNLVHLRISFQRYKAPSDLSQLLAILRASSELEVFILDSCDLEAPSEEDVSDTEAPVISLPRLLQLTFKECHATLMRIILHCLELPGTDTSITCEGWQPAHRDLASIFPPKSRSRLSSLHEATRLQIDFDGSEIHAASATSVTHIHSTHDLDFVDTIIPSLQHIMSLNAIQELWLSGIELQDTQFWQDTFAGMPALVKLTLDLTPTDPSKWLNALAPDADPNGRPYPVPALQSLTFFPPFPQASDDFLQMLYRRHQHGHPIQHVRPLLCGATRNENIRQTFVRWMDLRKTFEPSIGTVSFEMVAEYPRMDVSACKSSMG